MTLYLKHDSKGKKSTLSAGNQAIAEANKKCFVDLVLSIDTSTPEVNVTFAMIKGTKMKENPNGHLQNAFLRLKAKFEPSTTPQLMQSTRVPLEVFGK
jgi:hypothetical protein